MYGEACFSQKNMFRNRVNMDLILRAPVVHGVAICWLSGKKKLQGEHSVKKVIVFWDMKRLITIDFLEKGESVNSASIAHSYGKFRLMYWMTLVYVCVCVLPATLFYAIRTFYYNGYIV